MTENFGYILILIVLCIFLGIFYYDQYYMGDYIIQRQWISSVSEKTGVRWCDDCLWIEFYEGCNRYSTYYFKDQHIEDDRFQNKSIVNIDWYDCGDKHCINNIKLANKYRMKC